jgi:hypothetical protein
MSYYTKLLQSFLILTIFLLSQSVYSADSEMRFFIEEVTVKPANASEYHQAVPKVIAMMKEHNYKYKTNVITTNDGRYMWFTPAPQFAVMDDIFKQRNEIFSKLNAKQAAIFGQMNTATATSRSYFAKLDTALSHYSKEQNKGYRHFNVDSYHVKPGSEAKVEELGQKYVALHEKMGTPKDYYIYKSSIGMQGQQVVLVRFAKNAIHLATKLSDYQEKTRNSPEAMALYQQLIDIMISQDSYTGYNPEGFSYIPTKVLAKL